jgi:hypothetical protein
LIRAELKFGVGDDLITIFFIIPINGDAIWFICPASTAPVRDIKIGWHMPAIVLVEVIVVIKIAMSPHFYSWQ